MKIERIAPLHWYAGMRNPHLQLMISGPGVGRVSNITVSSPDVSVERVVRPDSPNYLFVYLDLTAARPGVLTLMLDDCRQEYVLKSRERAGDERQGFSMSDVLYLLMPDRFARGSRHLSHVSGMAPYRENRRQPSMRHGGDINGIREHLDYFVELGVTALWLTPVLENNSPDGREHTSTYHGYATTDFYRVDPRLGSLDDYRRLCDEAHARGLKVVMDLVFNHCSTDHPWLTDLPFRDWVNRIEGPDYLTNYKLTPVLDPYAAEVDRRETVEGWFTTDMPDLNLRNRHLRRYLTQNVKWWIETVGIDGVRMDTYPYVHAGPMAQCMRELREEYPHFNIVGETWVTEPAFTAAWQDALPTVMDFTFFDRVNRAKGEETDDWFDGLNRVYNTLCYDYLYRNPASVMAFLDNHDTDRFLGDGRDVSVLKQALALLLTIRRIPQLYYGTEILMSGAKQGCDGRVRRDFPGGFPGDRRNAFAVEGRTRAQQQMFEWLSRLLHWRRTSAAVTRGTQKHFIPQDGVYVIARQYEDQRVLTVLNGTSRTAVLRVSRYAEVIGSDTKARDVLTGCEVSLLHDLSLRPRQSLVLEFFRECPC